MENSVFNILITKRRYNISDNHQSDVTINSFDISLFFNIHVCYYVRMFFNNKKRIHIYLPTAQMLYVLWFQNFCLSRLLFSIKCFIECHKLSKYLYYVKVNRWFWFFFKYFPSHVLKSLVCCCVEMDKIKIEFNLKKNIKPHILHKANKFLCNRIVLTASSFNIFLTK